MLQDLSIRNFAIIDDLQISFPAGLTILSGETGTGKSIIISAVNLLLGSRATSKLTRTGAETAELEAIFRIQQKGTISNLLKENGFDVSEGLSIRRVIYRNDRHKAYINGRLATIQQLSTITENLTSISGQREHQMLLKEEQHLKILDQFGGLMPLRDKVYACYHEIVPLIHTLKDLKILKDRQSDHFELLEFQKKEITGAGISSGEDKALEQEKRRLKNSEVLYQTVYGAIEELYSTQGAIVERLLEVKKQLGQAGQIDPELTGKAEGIAGAAFQIEDITDELRGYLKKIEIDEGRLEEIEARLDILTRLKRKYGGTIESVFAHLEFIDGELSSVGNLSERISATEKQISELHDKLAKLALQLSSKRRSTAEIFRKKVEKELSTLKMSGTEFQISLEPIFSETTTDPHLQTENKSITESGVDRVFFLISPNVGEELKPLSLIASGGELSRVILAIKAILAETEAVETIVFDEVDAGIGGGVAEVVGKKLSSLSKYHQVICITHLPQIAKFGDHHFRISKQVFRGRTRTKIEPLTKDERIKELARMLGGEKITRATLNHAREMLKK
ncbi:MAG: DNA repair protein RecN [Deltaproteobacteria bacterium]|nr:DNA repair protein RecN [Deltaproteobacteria bacterium]